jgi:rSAM/selenodomain-associated transferase 2
MSGASPALAILVPVWHDTPALALLLAIARDPRDQWVVVNGDAADHTLDSLRAAHDDVCWLDSPPGRGRQLAAGLERVSAEWVVVLHADTRLGEGWRDDVTRRAVAASKVWGCFRLRLDTPAWQGRVVECLVRLRVRLFRLPYGDQGMFFRRSALEALGGIPAVPLMEDVILARRFAGVGAPFRSAVPAVTSARRWERDGWVRRSVTNVWLLTKYLVGVAPERLAAAYDGTRRC